MHFLVTIIIPCYNMGPLLLETIDSVNKVADRAIHEVLIVNDGSTDLETLRVLDSLRDEYIIIDQVNQGLSAARNTGIKAAKAECLIFLDADNLLMPGYLQQGLDVLNLKPGIDIVYGESNTFGDESGKLFTKQYSLHTLMTFNYIDACCLVRKSVFEEIGGFDQNMRQGFEDWEMWIRAGISGKKFHYLEGVVCQQYRVRNNSMLRTINKRKSFEIEQYIQDKHKHIIDFTGVSDYYYSKFRQSPFGWTAKLFIRKFFPRYYSYLVKKGSFRYNL